MGNRSSESLSTSMGLRRFLQGSCIRSGRLLAPLIPGMPQPRGPPAGVVIRLGVYAGGSGSDCILRISPPSCVVVGSWLGWG